VISGFRRVIGAAPDAPIPSPNIWNWPDVYERENQAQDSEGAIWAALRASAPTCWTSGAGTGSTCPSSPPKPTR
jgi:hypothetical protein